MAEEITCDRCNGEIAERDGNRFSIQPNLVGAVKRQHNYKDTYLDLCNTCLPELYKLMEAWQKGENLPEQVAVVEPPKHASSINNNRKGGLLAVTGREQSQPSKTEALATPSKKQKRGLNASRLKKGFKSWLGR